MGDEEEKVLDTTDLFTLEKLTALAERMEEDFRGRGRTNDAVRSKIVAEFVGALRDQLRGVASDNLTELFSDEEE